MATPTTFRKLRVLIVEDVTEMAALLGCMVESISGAHVCAHAANLWEARLEVSRNRPDLVLLDEVLPGESGLDFLPELVELGIPAVLISGVQETVSARGASLPRGALGRLKKPELMVESGRKPARLDWSEIQLRLTDWIQELNSSSGKSPDRSPNKFPNKCKDEC